MCGMKERRCYNWKMDQQTTWILWINKLFDLSVCLFHSYPPPGVWWGGSASTSTWIKAQVLWSELHRGGVQESQLRGRFSSGYFELRGCFLLGFSVWGWLFIWCWCGGWRVFWWELSSNIQAIVCWYGLRPAHLLKMMSQLGEEYRYLSLIIILSIYTINSNWVKHKIGEVGRFIYFCSGQAWRQRGTVSCSTSEGRSSSGLPLLK